MFTKEAFAQTWRDVRPYFIFAIILFAASVVVGGTPGGATDFIKDQVRAIAGLAQKAQNADNPELAFFWIIFKNNLTACLMTMYLGIMVGIFPVFTMALNGMVMGFLFGGMADEGRNVGMLIVKGILPHGIVELPALFLAAGFGMLLGVSVIKGVFGSLFGKTEPWRLFLRSIIGSVPAAILIVVMLLVAAIIESTITLSLMS